MLIKKVEKYWKVGIKENISCQSHHSNMHINNFHFFFPIILLSFFFLRWHLWPMEGPRLGVKVELQLPAYTMATAMLDSLILNPLNKARQGLNLHPHGYLSGS